MLFKKKEKPSATLLVPSLKSKTRPRPGQMCGHCSTAPGACQRKAQKDVKKVLDIAPALRYSIRALRRQQVALWVVNPAEDNNNRAFIVIVPLRLVREAEVFFLGAINRVEVK